MLKNESKPPRNALVWDVDKLQGGNVGTLLYLLLLLDTTIILLNFNSLGSIVVVSPLFQGSLLVISSSFVYETLWID
jgi:hypothetical protein